MSSHTAMAKMMRIVMEARRSVENRPRGGFIGK
jgi:hypothetical protein